MGFVQFIEQIAKQGAIYAPLLIISLALAVAFDRFFPREKLRALFEADGLPGSLLASAASAILPPSAGGKIPLAARFGEMGGRLHPTISFAIAGSALSLPGIILTFALGWRISLLRIASAIILGAVAGSLLQKRLSKRLEIAKPADWLSVCDPDYCDIRPEQEEWERTYPWKSFSWQLVVNVRIIMPWLALSLALAALLGSVIPRETFAALFGRWWSPLFAAGLGFPFFMVAGADVPLIQLLIAKGVSLGSTLPFMLGAPVVNFPVYALIKRWLGRAAAIDILVTAWIAAAAFGWLIMLAEWAGGKLL